MTMAKTEKLPIEVHDHFRKANILHGYVEDHLGEARDHALETGQELLAAKAAIPHGSWESECTRLFSASLRTAQFYMQFYKHMSALPKAQNLRILMLEGTLDGAAKAAKAAANPKPPKPEPVNVPEPDEPTPDEPIDVDYEPVDDPPEPDDEEDLEAPAPPKKPNKDVDYGKCPNCAGTKWEEDEDGVACAKCHHPHGESTGGADEDRVNTQRAKTRKTAEALMRAFDDLQTMKARPEYEEAIRLCKVLLTMANKWK